MEPPVFSLVIHPEASHGFRLEPCRMTAVSPAMWKRLASDIGAEATLMPTPASLLRGRCQEGYAAAAVYDDRIISYIALVPVIGRVPGAPSWELLTTGIERHNATLPSTSVYAFTSSWTAPPWRRRGISLALRPPLLDHHLQGNSLGILDMDGLASPVPAQLGWRIIAWNRVPFLSSLVSLPASEFREQAAREWTSPLMLRRYEGEHVPLDAPNHSWEAHFYFWTSNPLLAEKLDQEIRELFCGDLHGWRSVIAEVYRAPEILWKVPFD